MRSGLQKLHRSHIRLRFSYNGKQKPRQSGNPRNLVSCRFYCDETNRQQSYKNIERIYTFDSRSGADRENVSRTSVKRSLTFHRQADNWFAIENWEQRLVTFEQYQYESDLGTPTLSGSGPRLVDTLKYKTDFAIWLELVRFRRRHYGIEGLRVIWKEVLGRELHLPCYGATGDELWTSFTRLGFEDPNVLKELVSYAKNHMASMENSWPRLYMTIISHHLKNKPHHAYQWHVRLREDFPPSLAQLKCLFLEVVGDDATLQFFRPMYIDLGIYGMYDTIIPELCRRENYAMALKWHNLMLRKHDRPSHISVSEPLLQYLAVYGRHEHLMETTKALVDAGVSSVRITRTIIPNAPLISREVVNRQLGEIYGIAPKTFSDEFCARLFATRMFAIDTIINGLRVLGVDAIGPMSLKEICSRERSRSLDICCRIDQLKGAGISLGNSTFSSLVRKLALEDKGDLLNSVLTCDLHPDTYEDRSLQESLLASYHQAGDQRQVDRTLAILTFDSPPELLMTMHWNLLLRVHLTRRDLKEIQRTLETMREMQLMVDPRSSSCIRMRLVSRRQIGRRPHCTNELPTVINTWRQILQMGGVVPLVAWVEILKRLGMTGHLDELEALSLWLTNWYSKHAAYRAAGRGFPMLFVPRSLSRRHPLHPLRILFPTAMQQAIATWGFQHRANGTTKGRACRQIMGRPPWTWGLQLLLKLRQRKVMVGRRTVARVCRQRLKALFGPGTSKRKINRRAQRLNKHYHGQYVTEMLDIWGPDLFKETDDLLANPLDRRLRRSQLKHSIAATPSDPHVGDYVEEP